MGISTAGKVHRGRATKGMRYGGRAKGTPNRFTSTVKQMFESVFDALQKDKGTPPVKKHGLVISPGRPSAALLEWALRNPDDYYKLAAKLIPVQLTGEGGGPVQVSGSVTLYLPNNSRRVEPVPAGKAVGAATKRKIKLRKSAKKASP